MLVGNKNKSTFWNHRRHGTFIPKLKVGKNCIEDDLSSNSFREVFELNATSFTLYYFCRFDSVKIQEKMLFNVLYLIAALQIVTKL